MSDLTDAIAYLDGELVDVTYEDPIGIALAAARRVAEAPEVLYCTNHYQLGNELWCTYGRIWDKECRMVLADLHPRPDQEEPS